MAMTRKRRRLYFIMLGLLGLGAGTALVLTAFQDNIVFFFSPTEVATRHVAQASLHPEGDLHQIMLKGVTQGQRGADLQRGPTAEPGPPPVGQGCPRDRTGHRLVRLPDLEAIAAHRYMIIRKPAVEVLVIAQERGDREGPLPRGAVRPVTDTGQEPAPGLP